MDNMKITAKDKFNTIKLLKEDRLNEVRARIILNCSHKTIKRLLKRFDSDNPNCFEHKNKGKTPSNKTDDKTRNKIIALKKTEYSDYNFSHFAEELQENKKINVSHDTVRRICYENFLVSKWTHNQTKKELEKIAKNKEEKLNLIKSSQEEFMYLNLVKKNQHCRVQIKPIFGNVVEADASEFRFFGNEKSFLHLFIEQSTGAIVGYHLDEQETLSAYQKCLYHMLKYYGIPLKIVTDCRSCFTNNRHDDENSRLTQFGCWCDNAGIELYSTTTSQKKPRVERAHRTVQDRFTAEMKRLKIKTIDEANKLLHKLVKKYNKKFARNHQLFENAFVPFNENVYGDLKTFLSVRRTRYIGNGNTFQIDNQVYYVTHPETKKIVNILPHTKALILINMDGKMAVNIANNFYGAVKCGTYSTEEIPVITFPATYKQWYTLHNFLNSKIEHPVVVNEIYEKPIKVKYNNWDKIAA